MIRNLLSGVKNMCLIWLCWVVVVFRFKEELLGLCNRLMVVVNISLRCGFFVFWDFVCFSLCIRVLMVFGLRLFK